MKTANQEDIAATAVLLYQSMSNKRACVEVSDVSDDESVQSTKRRKLSPSTKPKDNLRPAPFFYYRDHSKEQDEDPLAPLTPPGCTANFPAKMHAMLSRKDLAGVVAWLPHGRAWRVLKPKVFASEVVPSYFGHSKFASFVRQANGWGFRRITNGPERGAYYHERFLRGLPHLCKKMKRPGKNEKMAIEPEHEPDLFRISEMFPITEEASADDGIMLESTFRKVRPSARSAFPPIGNNSTTESIPRSVTPLSEVTPSQSPTPSTPRSPAHSLSFLKIPQTIAMQTVRPQGPAAQSTLLPPVPVNLCSPTPYTQNGTLPQTLPSLLRQPTVGTITPTVPALQALLQGTNKQVPALPLNQLQGFPSAPAVGAKAVGGLDLLQQALLAASCGRPAFM